MPDLDESTLFGERQDDEVRFWPHAYGGPRQLIERTLFGELSLWKLHPWPEGYGGTP